MDGKARFFWVCLLGVAWAGWVGSAFATDPSAAFWNMEKGVNPASGWFGPVSVFPHGNMTVWRATLRPPPGNAPLALTLVFSEAQGGFARLIWQGPGRAITLCGNLYETGLSRHQRTLFLARESLGGSGQLIVESTGSVPVLERVELRWVEPRILVPEGSGLSGVYLAGSEKFLGWEDLRAEGWRPLDDHPVEGVMDALVDAGPVRTDPQTPIRFLVPIRGPVSHARIEVSVAGMSPGTEPQIAVNGQRLAAVSAEVPGLADAGYRFDPSGSDWGYAGWRTVTAYVPPGFLQPGSNQIDWIPGNGGDGQVVRNFRLQVVGAQAGPPGRAPASVSPSPTVPDPGPAPRISFRGELSSPRTTLGLRQE